MKQYLASFICVLALVYSCNNTEQDSSQEKTDHAAAIASYESAQRPTAKNSRHESMNTSQPGNGHAQQEPVVRQRMIIHTGELSFETKNMAETHHRIKDAALACNGYLSRDESNAEGETRSHTIEARIPAARFDEFLSAVTDVAGKGITDRNIRANDVTEEYVDVEARATSKKALEARYADLLDRASTVKDMLEIEHEMGVLREEIESMEGRMNYLRDRAEFGTLTITFRQPAPEIVAAQQPGFLSKVGNSISSGWQGLLGLVVGLLAIWPVWVFVAVAVWFIKRLIRKETTRKSNFLKQHTDL